MDNFLVALDNNCIYWSYFWNAGEQNELSLIGNLHPLTPQIAEDVEDMQAIEHIAVHGAFASGIREKMIFPLCATVF